MLERNAGRLLDCRERLNFCPLGACALAGTGLPIDRFMTSDALGFTAPMRNSMDAVSDRDFVLELLSANSIIFVPLSRLGEELVLWTSEEFGFITPSDLVSTGSSMMPQKKNPDPMELVRGKSARGIGDLMRLLTLCKGLPLAYNHDLQEDKEPVFDSVKTIIGMLEVSAEFAQNIAINLDRIQKTLPAGHLDATTLADYLVHKRTQEAPGAKKIVMTAEYFQWVTQALVMRLRQHGETVAREGTELAGMRQRGQIQWFSVGDKKDTLKD